MGEDGKERPTSLLNVAHAMNRLAVAFWQSMQWHRLVKTGVPVILSCTAPQRHEPVRGFDLVANVGSGAGAMF